MEKYRERKNDLRLVFNDLEKACDSVLHKIIWDSLEAIQDMYNGVTTSIYVQIGLKDYFLGLYHGSTLNHFIFAIIIDEL